ncbi:hypothetical protein A33Q_1878 [Indibacter alkaliphilus LW1]|uniref:Uncharacterized protein n=1 Tax=Indibacter alkaliphilus (strain CCUG 57479 / KCTC 22604 / LW1) TaxID=1189612 RepID=S2DID4_INDAL|nr:hypothetical protein A33Q_1878 [Indibacter alkaliphilus LW1]
MEANSKILKFLWGIIVYYQKFSLLNRKLKNGLFQKLKNEAANGS